MNILNEFVRIVPFNESDSEAGIKTQIVMGQVTKTVIKAFRELGGVLPCAVEVISDNGQSIGEIEDHGEEFKVSFVETWTVEFPFLMLLTEAESKTALITYVGTKDKEVEMFYRLAKAEREVREDLGTLSDWQIRLAFFDLHHGM